MWWNHHEAALLALIPFCSYILIRRNFKILATEEFDGTYGTLYQNMNPTKRQVQTYNTYFCLKRLVIGLATVYLNHFTVAVSLLNIATNFCFVSFIASSWPMNCKFLNQLEVMNEATMLVFCYFFLLFSNLTADAEARYMLGKVFMRFTLTMIAINMGLISNSLFRDIMLDRKKKQATKAWEDYERLKEQMATFIVVNR